MSGTSISARVNRALGLVHRRLLLLRPRLGYLQPEAEGRPGPPVKVLVLQASPNPTVDYFICSRLRSAGTGPEWTIINSDARPQDISLLDEDGLLVVVCRYITPVWLRALERRATQLHGLVYLVDDDLPAMVKDRTIPVSARGRILRDYARHQARLARIVTAVWVTSASLAEVLPHRPERVLTPRPTEAPQQPDDLAPTLVAYHGGVTHQRERLFVFEVARSLGLRRPDINFEISEPGVTGPVRSAPNIKLVPCVDWTTYRHAQAGREATIMLAPLFDTPVNRARAPVKFFDAARIGAVGIYADAPAYNGFVRPELDGVIVPMVVDEWVRAIERLVDEVGVRNSLALTAHNKVADMWNLIEPLEFMAACP